MSRRHWCLAAVLIGSASATLMQNFITVSLPTIASELAGHSTVGWVVGAYMLASTAVLLNSGRWADRQGPRKVYVVGTLLYAAAMAADAFSALFFGWLYDKYGTVSLVWSTLLSMPFVFFIFMAPSSCWLYAGVLLWGIGMGAQESTLKAAVAAIVPKHERAVGYGIFETGFGVSWFIGSFLLGILYDASILWMAAISALMQAAAVPFFFLTGRQKHRLEV